MASVAMVTLGQRVWQGSECCKMMCDNIDKDDTGDKDGKGD